MTVSCLCYRMMLMVVIVSTLLSLFVTPVSCLQTASWVRFSPTAPSSLLMTIGSDDDNPIRAVESSGAPKPVGPYSQAVWAGNTLYCSGQVGLDPVSGKLVGDGDVEKETRQALLNLDAVLQEAGVSCENVVRTTVFLANLEDFSRVNAIYATFFDGQVTPSRACVEVAALPLGARVEIDCIAVK